MHFSSLRPENWPKNQNLENPKIKFEKPKKMKHRYQKWDFLGHQVKIRSTFENSEVHWIDIACYILENKIRIPRSIKQDRKNLQLRFFAW